MSASSASSEPAGGKGDTVSALAKLFDQSVRALGDAGETDLACRLAAAGWAVLRHDWPRDAERLNGALHYLTQHRGAIRRGDR